VVCHAFWRNGKEIEPICESVKLVDQLIGKNIFKVIIVAASSKSSYNKDIEKSREAATVRSKKCYDKDIAKSREAKIQLLALFVSSY